MSVCAPRQCALAASVSGERQGEEEEEEEEEEKEEDGGVLQEPAGACLQGEEGAAVLQEQPRDRRLGQQEE